MADNLTGKQIAGLGAGVAGLGGLSSLFGGGGFGGKDAAFRSAPIYNGLQSNALDQLTNQGLQNSNFEGTADRARRDFQTKTIPSIAERFSSFGGSGLDAQRTSAFGGALGQAGADLDSQLNAQRGQFGLQQLGLGLRPQQENYFEPRKSGFFEGGLESLTSLLPLLMFL